MIWRLKFNFASKRFIANLAHFSFRNKPSNQANTLPLRSLTKTPLFLPFFGFCFFVCLFASFGLLFFPLLYFFWCFSFILFLFKQTFHFRSSYWNLANEYNLAGGESGFDSQETKLRTYWNSPFHKICLGMKIDQQKKFIVLTGQASSLYSLIADGTHRPTSLGRSAWLSLIGAQASLLPNCNREGFNAVSGRSDLGKPRICIICNK